MSDYTTYIKQLVLIFLLIIPITGIGMLAAKRFFSGWMGGGGFRVRGISPKEYSRPGTLLMGIALILFGLGLMVFVWIAL